MGKRFSTKNKKRKRDIQTANKNGTLPTLHKIGEALSKKVLFRKNNRMK